MARPRKLNDEDQQLIETATEADETDLGVGSGEDESDEPIPQDTLMCALTGQLKIDKPEERVLQSLIEQLHREYHVELSDMERDVKVACRDGAGKKKTVSIGVAVYESGKPHNLNNIIRTVLVAKGNAKVSDAAIGQLDLVLSNLSETRSTTGREEYAAEIREARLLLEQTAEMRDALETCSIRSSRSVLWDGPLPALRAWNFAAGGGVVRLLGQRWKTQLRDVLVDNGIFNGPRFARVECLPPHGIDFLSQRDVFMIRSVGRRIVVPDIPKRLLFVPRNALLVGSHGQMNEGSIFGKIELASFAGWRSGVTQDILRVLPKDRYRELAYAFLSTAVGQWLLKSTAVGTSIPSMRVDLLERLPFPDPSTVPLDDIRQHVLKAEEARIAADEAEVAAICMIEEEVLPQWLA